MKDSTENMNISSFLISYEMIKFVAEYLDYHPKLQVSDDCVLENVETSTLQKTKTRKLF